MKNKTKRKWLGFTLIEVLTTIATIAILSTIILVYLGNAKETTRDIKRTQDLDSIRNALELYYLTHEEYPQPHAAPAWEPTPDDILVTLKQNWSDMLDILAAEGLLSNLDINDYNQYNYFAGDFWETVKAQLNIYIQDPLYPDSSYGYMPSSHPLYQNFRVRAQLEKGKDAILKNGRDGKFFYSDETTGLFSCDKSLKVYCLGPSGNFDAFDPGKPVLYLYPEQEIKVRVKINPKEVIESVPIYEDGWEVIASPDGSLLNIKDGKTYPYLFWEGKSGESNLDKTKGFIIKTLELENFFQDKLAQLGLTESEIANFMEYWVPRMKKNKKYLYVHFLPGEDIDKLLPMTIDPQPDTLIRVYFFFRALDYPLEGIEEQVLTAPERKGFTAVEWGGDRRQVR